MRRLRRADGVVCFVFIDSYGPGGGVPCGLDVGSILGVGEGLGVKVNIVVKVAVAVDVTVAVGVSADAAAGRQAQNPEALRLPWNMPQLRK
jgi:hypothetical protein